MCKSKISNEIKVEYVEKYNAEKNSVKEIAKRCNVNITTVRSLVRNYDFLGRPILIMDQ